MALVPSSLLFLFLICVSNSFFLLLVRPLLLVAMHLFLVACCSKHLAYYVVFFLKAFTSLYVSLCSACQISSVERSFEGPVRIDLRQGERRIISEHLRHHANAPNQTDVKPQIVAADVYKKSYVLKTTLHVRNSCHGCESISSCVSSCAKTFCEGRVFDACGL